MGSTRTLYDFRDIRRSGSGSVCARFSVEDHTGQSHDELLGFTIIEARILMWDDLMARDPSIVMRDQDGFANYRAYVKALVEGLRQHAI